VQTDSRMRLDSLIVNSDAPENCALCCTPPFSLQLGCRRNGGCAGVEWQADFPPRRYATHGLPQSDILGYWTDLCSRYIVNLPGFGKSSRRTEAVFETERLRLMLPGSQASKKPGGG
jgi:hypothetical protein